MDRKRTPKCDWCDHWLMLNTKAAAKETSSSSSLGLRHHLIFLRVHILCFFWCILKAHCVVGNQSGAVLNQKLKLWFLKLLFWLLFALVMRLLKQISCFYEMQICSKMNNIIQSLTDTRPSLFSCYIVLMRGHVDTGWDRLVLVDLYLLNSTLYVSA